MQDKAYHLAFFTVFREKREKTGKDDAKPAPILVLPLAYHQ
jgi:hypothetical protein